MMETSYLLTYESRAVTITFHLKCGSITVEGFWEPGQTYHKLKHRRTAAKYALLCLCQIYEKRNNGNQIG